MVGSSHAACSTELVSRLEVGLVPIFYLCGSNSMASKAEVIQKMVEPVIGALGYQLWGLEYLGQGRHTMLRIYLDKPGGINIDDCAEASRHISSLLDVEDPIKDEYTLEVSSPGLDRYLFTPAQYEQYLNESVKVRLSQAVSGRRNFAGVLHSITAQGNEWVVEIKVGEDVLSFPFGIVERAQVVAQ